MKELTDIDRRIREHSGLVYNADLKELQRIASEKAQENDELRTQLQITETRIGELEQDIKKLEEEIAHVNMLADASTKLAQDLKNELYQYKEENPDTESTIHEVVQFAGKDEFGGVVLGEQE